MRSSPVVAFTVVLLVGSPPLAAHARAVPAGEPSLESLWKQFRNGAAPKSEHDGIFEDGLGSALWKAGRADARLAFSVSAVAKEFGINEATATDLVEATLAERYVSELDEDTPEQALVDRVMTPFWRAYQREPGAAIVVQQASWILFSSERSPSLNERVIHELGRSSDPAPLTARIAWTGLLEEDTRRAAVANALAHRPGHPVLLLQAAALAQDDACASAAWAREAVIAGAMADPSDGKFLATARNRLLLAMLDAGSTREAVALAKSIPPTELDGALSIAPSNDPALRAGLEYEVKGTDVRAALASAAFLEHESDFASRLLNGAPKPSARRDEHSEEAEMVDLVHAAATQLAGESSIDAFDTLEHAVEVIGRSWNYESFTTLAVLEQLAGSTGYPEFIPELSEHVRDARAVLRAVPDGRAPEVDACRAHSAQLAEAMKTLSSSSDAAMSAADPGATIIATALAAKPLSVYTERPLPEGVPPCDASARTDGGNDKSLEKWHVPDLWPVRVEKSEGVVVAIGLSQAYDPAGETSGGGYWIVRSTDNGKTWERPRYAGLRPMHPYVVCAQSRMPLLVGGRLHIEVAIRELDESKITFPPIGRSFKQERSGLFLDAAWADIERDSDGDGLTDLAEERLLTDPLLADTDGDGLTDGTDPLPHIPTGKSPSARAGALAATLAQGAGANARAIFPSDPGGQGPAEGTLEDTLQYAHRDLGALPSEDTLFVIGDRKAFSGILTDRRVVVLSEAEAELASARFGRHYPARLRLFVNHAGTRALAIWSESWRGFTMELTNEHGTWRGTTVSQWIT